MDYIPQMTTTDVADPYLKLHRLFRRLQQKNRFVSRSQDTALSLIESHTLIEVDGQGNIGVGELAKMFLVDKSSVSRALDSLERQGLITSKQSPEDARRRFTSVTTRGHHLLARLDENANSIMDGFAEHLRAREVGELRSFLKLLADGHGGAPSTVRKSDHPLRPEIRRLTRVLGLLGAKYLDLDISPTHWQVLSEVALNPHPQTPSSLCETLATPRNTMSQILGVLERDKLLTRETHRTDKRSSILSLTPLGHRRVKGVEKASRDRIYEALRDVPLRDLHRFIFLLDSFVGDTFEGSARLADAFIMRGLSSNDERRAARAHILQYFQRHDLEEYVPEQLFASDSHCFGLYEDTQMRGACEIRTAEDSFLLNNLAVPGQEKHRDIGRAFLERSFEAIVPAGANPEIVIPAYMLTRPPFNEPVEPRAGAEVKRKMYRLFGHK